MCRSTKIHFTTLPINIKDHFMVGKVCLMTDLARNVLLFRVYCLPTRWFSCTQLPYLGRERRRQTNSWLKLDGCNHTRKAHTRLPEAKSSGISIYSRQGSNSSYLCTLYSEGAHQVCAFIYPISSKHPTRPSRSLQNWTAHDSQLGGKILQRISLNNHLKTFLIFRNTT